MTFMANSCRNEWNRLGFHSIQGLNLFLFRCQTKAKHSPYINATGTKEPALERSEDGELDTDNGVCLFS